ncbi:MAG: hypothetical protein ACLUTZ_14400 [Oliverpabstia sp.]
MKKNKNLVRVSIVASLLITTSSILGQNVEVMASNPTNYKDMMEYAAYENVIADAGASSGDFGISLALYDIDQDGIRELLISHGTCLADWVNDIYTLEDGKYVELYWKCRQTGIILYSPRWKWNVFFCMDIKDIRR